MWIWFITSFVFNNLTLFQFSDNTWKLLEQYPPLFVVAIVAYYMYRMQREENKVNREWLDKMLSAQRESLKDAYDSKNMFEAAFLAQINAKQNGLNDRIELLTQQMAVNTATVSEIAKVDSIVQELISRLETK